MDGCQNRQSFLTETGIDWNNCAMIRSSDYTFPNPPDDIPSPLMKQAKQAFMLPWPRKPLSGKPKAPPRQLKSKSGLNKLKRVSHPNPYF